MELADNDGELQQPGEVQGRAVSTLSEATMGTRHLPIGLIGSCWVPSWQHRACRHPQQHRQHQRLQQGLGAPSSQPCPQSRQRSGPHWAIKNLTAFIGILLKRGKLSLKTQCIGTPGSCHFAAREIERGTKHTLSLAGTTAASNPSRAHHTSSSSRQLEKQAGTQLLPKAAFS